MKRLFAAFSGDFLLIVVWLEKPAGALFDRSIYELPSTGLESNCRLRSNPLHPLSSICLGLLSLWELPRSNLRAATWKPWARTSAAPSSSSWSQRSSRRLSPGRPSSGFWKKPGRHRKRSPPCFQVPDVFSGRRFLWLCQRSSATAGSLRIQSAALVKASRGHVGTHMK